MSSENQSKSPRRRIRIMNTLMKGYLTSSSNLLNTINPFSKKSGNGKREDKDDPKRFSLGEYFDGKRDYKENIKPNFKSEPFEQEFLRNEWEIKRKGADAFFASHAHHDDIEPEDIDVRCQSSKRRSGIHKAKIALVEENVSEDEISENSDDSRLADILKDFRELDRQIRELRREFPLRPGTTERTTGMSPRDVEKTPTMTYPSLLNVRRTPDNFTPKKLFHENVGKKNEIIPDVITEANDNVYLRSVIPEKETFSTPMPIPDSQISNLVYAHQHQRNYNNESASASFLKYQDSVINNLPSSKMLDRKPNLESTRKSEKTFASYACGEGTTISTLTLPNTPSSPLTMDEVIDREQHQQQTQPQTNTKAQYNLETTMPYEVENFLELALGDEQYNTSVTYANVDAKSSVINVSELISEDITPRQQMIPERGMPPMTEPLKRSSTLNRTLTMYNSFTQRMKNKFRGSIKDVPEASQHVVVLSDASSNLENSIKDLLEKVKIQQTLMNQASMALELCKTKREFVSSPERVESERILLSAELRHKAYLDEIGRVTSQHQDNELYCERGQITIKDMSVQLREGVLRCDYKGGNFVEWFVLVVSEGATVWATDAVPCPIVGQRIKFKGELSIPDLPPVFRISINIYSITMPKIDTDHEKKYHIRRARTSRRQSALTTCLSPIWLLKMFERRMTPEQSEVRFSGTKESSFVMCGSVDLFLHDLNLKSPWPLSRVPPKSVLHGTIDLDLSCKLQLSVTHAGFLTHSDGIGGPTSWNRRWCVLEDRSLHFWNYPREQEYKPPLYSIDLECCVSRKIGPIDRSCCPRARTLLIETMRKRKDVNRNTNTYTKRRLSCSVVKHLLSFDSNQDLTEWQSKLNHVVSALREWNIIES